MLRSAVEEILSLPDLREAITRALVDDPPATSRLGDLIREGYSNEVDELRAREKALSATVKKLRAELEKAKSRTAPRRSLLHRAGARAKRGLRRSST